MTVAAEQFSSSGEPRNAPSGRRKLAVWQMKGFWCGPEMIGPVIG
jgi:hypothetical protein